MVYSRVTPFTPQQGRISYMALKHNDLISIIIPTLNRPKPLRRALESVLHQSHAKDVTVEVLVVDNSSDQSALWVASEFAACSTPVKYISEPVPGVANARNAGIRQANGRWVAFLDDDEEATPDWLAHHVQTLRQTGADASFGPVFAKAEEGVPPDCLLAFFSRLIERPNHSDITDLSAFLGTNNSVFDRRQCLMGQQVFDPTLNETGGEDSLLLRQLILSGHKFAWSAHARVTEWVPSRRLSWAYVRRRRFLNGQIRTLVNYKLVPSRWNQIIFWMGAGTIQAVGWTAASLVMMAFNKELFGM